MFPFHTPWKYQKTRGFLIFSEGKKWCIGKKWVHHTINAWKVSKYGVFSGSYFPVFGLNTEIYGVNLRHFSRSVFTLALIFDFVLHHSSKLLNKQVKLIPPLCWSSQLQMFLKISVLKNFANFPSGDCFCLGLLQLFKFVSVTSEKVSYIRCIKWTVHTTLFF